LLHFIRSWVLAAAMLPSFSALAQGEKVTIAKTGVQLRVDGVGLHKRAGDSAPTDSQSLVIRNARILVTGDLSEAISYTLRLDVKNALYSSENVGQDTSIAALDRAYVEQHFLPWLALKVGRMPLMSGAIESDYSSMDRYYESYFVELVSYQVAPITTGIDLSATTSAHTFSLQVFNGVQETTGVNKGLQQAADLSTAVGYRGSLFGGMIKPIVSYNQFVRIRGGKGSERDDTTMFRAGGVGAQFSVAGADLDLEYDVFRKPGFRFYTWDGAGVARAIDNPQDELRTVVTQLAYFDSQTHLRPFVKWSQDRNKMAGEERRNYVRYAYGVEYRPLPKGFRYHAVVVDQQDSDRLTNASRVTTASRKYILGLAAKI